MTRRPNTLNREDLVEMAAARSGHTEALCRWVLQELLGAYHAGARTGAGAFYHGEVARRLRDGATVVFKGLGAFEPRPRKARPARNPRTGEVVMLPRRRVAVCHFGILLLDDLKAKTDFGVGAIGALSRGKTP